MLLCWRHITHCWTYPWNQNPTDKLSDPSERHEISLLKLSLDNPLRSIGSFLIYHEPPVLGAMEEYWHGDGKSVPVAEGKISFLCYVLYERAHVLLSIHKITIRRKLQSIHMM